MFFNFVDELRAAGISASFKEHLTLLEALERDVIEQTPEAFYYLSRATFVKDEGLIDRFDQVFNKVFKGILTDYGQAVEIPEDWLKAVAEKFLSEEEMEKIKSLGDWDEIMETLKNDWRSNKRHEYNKWIGTGAPSISHSGYNLRSIVGGPAQKSDKGLGKKEFKNLDSTKEQEPETLKWPRILLPFARRQSRPAT